MNFSFDLEKIEVPKELEVSKKPLLLVKFETNSIEEDEEKSYFGNYGTLEFYNKNNNNLRF
jgi:hypothetical protein